MKEKETMKEKEDFRVERFTSQAGELELILPDNEERTDDGKCEVQEEQ